MDSEQSSKTFLFMYLDDIDTGKNLSYFPGNMIQRWLTVGPASQTMEEQLANIVHF